ncbi:outer membrane beta-barrel family protein [Flavobacterium beibuense]|uniref:Putative TonB-dependent receptor n=1 Tax=Flavobacterium beibuense TaxID=657326 RepID=A0A444W933_9FLAO|nr:outer membrane beta-barrel family protein [Flavobacterium beibuense]RYJ42411.1 putative TonB-dependent receptor [Flavobacterium beibuense]
MKKIQSALLILLLLTSFISFSQGKPGNVTISGKLIDQETKQPLEFATVTIQTTDNNTVNGAMTNEKGSYSVQVPAGTYNIKFDFISFKSQVISNKTITADTDLGSVIMAPDATLLKTVEIRAERSTVDIKLDKKVYNVGQDMIVKGGTISDVLDNVPSVTVDVEGNVSLRGNESVTIMIDGKPSNLYGANLADVLRVLPADSVDKIEVITNPSARYDAEGGGGIINIILKKGKAQGFNGSVTANTGDPANHGIMGNLNFRTEKFNFFTNLGYNYRNSPGNSMTDSEYFDGDGNTTSFINERRTNERKRKGYNATVGFEWDIDTTFSWTNSVSARNSNGDNPTDTYYYNYFADGTFNNTRYRYNLEDEEDRNFNYTTSFLKKFNGDGHELKVDATISRSTDDENSQISDMILGSTNPDDSSTERTLNHEEEKRTLVQADYVLPLGEESRFEAGYRGSFTQMNTDARAEILDDAGVWQPNANFSSMLEYNEYVNAFYAQYGSKFGEKFSYLLGLRWEDSNIDVNLLSADDFNKKKYNNFFPSAFLTYEFSEGTSANISYSRRINRPRGRFINPFSSLQSNINIFQGNPDLNPSMTDAFDIGYLKKWDKVTLSSSAYFNITNDSFQFVRRTEDALPGETPVTYVSPINLAKEYRFGFELTANYNPFRWWKLNANFNFFRVETDGDYSWTYTNTDGEVITDYQNFDNTAYSWFTRASSKMNLPWKIDWQINGTYNAPQNTAQGRNLGIMHFNTALSKDVLKEKATVTLNVSDIFNSNKRKGYTNLPTVSSYSEWQWRQRQVTLSFTYRFNMNKQQRMKEERQNGGGDDEYMGG